MFDAQDTFALILGSNAFKVMQKFPEHQKPRTPCKYVWFSYFYNEKNIENLIHMYGFHVFTMKKHRKHCNYVWFSLFRIAK